MPGHNLMPKLKPTAFFLPSPIEQRGAGTSNTQPSKLKTDAPVHMHGCCLLFPRHQHILDTSTQPRPLSHSLSGGTTRLLFPSL